MSLFNLFPKSKSPIENHVLSIRSKILDHLLKAEDYRGLPSNILLLESEYKKFIATILSGALVSINYEIKRQLSIEDPIIKRIFEIILHESILFHKCYVVPDIINYDILSHDGLKEKNYLLIYILTKFNRYSEDLKHGINSNESYYFEEIDDPDCEYSGYKNHFPFIKELFFIETLEKKKGIEIRRVEYNLDIDSNNFDEFFPLLLSLYNNI